MRRLAAISLLCTILASDSGAAEEVPAWKPLGFEGAPLTGLRVALDIGHYRLKPGAMSARGRAELLFNNDTARVIASVLKKAGATVILVNANGDVVELAKRPEIAAKEKADCFISIHHDSVNDKYLRKWVHAGVERDYADNFRGYSVFTSAKNAKADQSRALALSLGRALHESGLKPTLHHAEPIQGENRPLLDEQTGVYEFTDLVVLKSATIPAILLECGVIINREEELTVQRPDYQQVLAHAVVRALSENFMPKKRGFRALFGR